MDYYDEPIDSLLQANEPIKRLLGSVLSDSSPTAMDTSSVRAPSLLGIYRCSA